MKTILFTPLFLFFAFITSAQPISDQSYTDCDGNTESIYGIIGQGTPLIIASKGLDCSICMSQAPAAKTFSEANPQVRVWGAMNYKYSSVQPTCTASNQWKNDYSWNSIFMFLDLNDDWVGFGFPFYYVISPVDSQLAYEGTSFEQAKTVALSFMPTGIKPAQQATLELQYDAVSRTLQFNNPAGTGAHLSLVNSAGQVIVETQLSTALHQATRLILSEKLAAGVYLVLLRDEKKGNYTGKLLIQ